MTSDESLQFMEHLRRNNHLTKANANGEPAEQGGSSRRQGKLWELTNLSASEFADEAARFADLERVTLQDMLSAPALSEAFSQRFLREMMVFPCQRFAGEGRRAACERHSHRAVSGRAGGPLAR
jgi:general secretion pathway protein E